MLCPRNVPPQEHDMADLHYLKKRRQGWYSRVPVPRPLQALMGGKTHLERTLKTRDLTVAQRRRWQHAQDAQEQFERVRRASGGEASLSPEEIEERAWKAYEAALKEADEGEGLDEDGIDSWLSALQEDIEGSTLDEVEVAEAWAKVAALNGRSAALRGRPYQPPGHFGRRGVDRVTLKPVARRGRKIATGDALAFSEAAERYLAEIQRDPAARLTEQTVAQAQAVHRLFRDYTRDSALADVTRAMAGEFLDTVATLDPNWGRSPKTKERTLEDLLDRFGDYETGLSNRTLNRYSNSISAIYKWARKRGHYDGSNPFEGQSRKQATSRETGWLPYTDVELILLLDAMRPTVAPNKHTTNTALAWVAWIGAFSGMRINEICSLTVDDLRQEEGVWYFDVKDAKTEAGDRRVPVHSMLIRAGLLEYRGRLEGGSMWPALKPGGPDKKLSAYVVKRFGERRRVLGITRSRVTYHSLRKNAIGCLEQAGVPQNEAAEIVGHEKVGITYSVYSPEGRTMKQRQAVVEKISYPGVNV